MPHFEISKAQYAGMIREIEDLIKKKHAQWHAMSGSGRFDLSAPETIDMHPLSDMPFWVHDDMMEGGGFFSSIGNAFKNVYKAMKSSGMVDKAKDALLKKGRELGADAVNAAAAKAEAAAASKGYDISHLTKQGVERAHDALHKAEGHADKLLSKAERRLDSTMGLKGDGLMQTGDGMVMSGDGMFMVGRGAGFKVQPLRTPGIPKGSMMVGEANHIPYRMPAGGY